MGLEESLHLKPINITLAQRSYDEDEDIDISDSAWKLYQKHCRMVRTRPITRRGLMGLIFSLSQKLFGKWSTRKITTCRRVPCEKNGSKKIKCYNYEGDDLMVRVHVGLADWSERDLHDFDLGIAAKYKLNGCQRRDREAAKQYAEDLRKRKSDIANHSKGPLNKFFTESNAERYIPNPEIPNPAEMAGEKVKPKPLTNTLVDRFENTTIGPQMSNLRKRKSNSANHSNKISTESNIANPPEMVLNYVAPLKTKKNPKCTSLKDKSQVMHNVSKDRNPKQHKQCHITDRL